MKTAEHILDVNGFDFEAFKYENEYSAKNLLLAMKEYAKYYHETEVKKLNIANVMPALPELNEDSNCDHNFRLGWEACWQKLNEGNGA